MKSKCSRLDDARVIRKTKQMMKLVYDRNLFLKNFFLSVVFVFVVFAAVLNPTFVSDAMHPENGVELASIKDLLIAGRPSMWLLSWIDVVLYQFGIYWAMNAWFLRLLLIILISIAISIVASTTEGLIKDNNDGVARIFVLGATVITFTNPLFLEIFTYSAWEWGLGVVLCAYAARLFIEKKTIMPLVLLLIAENIYQNLVEIFLIWITLFIFLDSKNEGNGQIIKKAFKGGMFAGISILSNLLLVKVGTFLTGQSEVKPINNGETISLIRMIKNVWDAYVGLSSIWSFEPAYFIKKMIELLIFICILTVIYVGLIKKEGKFQIKTVVLAGLVFVFVTLFHGLIYAMAGTLIDGRISWPAFGALSVIFITIYVLVSDVRISRILCSLCLLITVFMVIYSTETYITDYTSRCAMDTYVVRSIQEYINEYEEDSREKIENISVYKQGMKGTYDELYFTEEYKSFSYTNKIYCKDWSDVNFLNMICNKHYSKQVMSNEDYNRLFGDRLINEYDIKDQLVFEGNTLYWVIR